MDIWLREIELKSKNVSFIPMSADHRDALLEAASDGNLWDLWYTSVPSAESVDAYIKQALSDKNSGIALPFVVVENESGKIIGSTRFCNASPVDRRVEIGYTWYARSYQKTTVNTECKILMLSYAFEQLDAIAVEFRTHFHNMPSRKAIERLGAKQDGILRNHKLESDGTYRDTVVFSIIRSEWPTVKKSLDYKFKRFNP